MAVIITVSSLFLGYLCFYLALVCASIFFKEYMDRWVKRNTTTAIILLNWLLISALLYTFLDLSDNPSWMWLTLDFLVVIYAIWMVYRYRNIRAKDKEPSDKEG